MKLSVIVAIAASVVLGTACGSCGSSSGSVKPAPRTFAQVKVVTFNAGLGPGMVRHSTPRTLPVANALAELDHDVLCLQEMWTEDAERVALDAFGLPDANVHVVDTAGEGETGRDRCLESELQPVLDCVTAQCADVAAEDTTLCALDSCRLELFALYGQRPECVTCLAASAGEDAAGIWDACTSGEGASRVHGGRNGIVLASKWPLTNRRVLRLDASGANRVALVATVERPDGPWFDVACTHLSAGQSVPPMHTGHASWDDEKAAQLKAIDALIDERAASGLPMVFAGDMNFGGAKGGNGSSASDVWDLATELGYRSPAFDAQPDVCSVCPDSSFRSPDYTPKVIDHVLYLERDADLVRPLGVERVLDGLVSTTDAFGDPLETHLSDHFGIRVTLEIAEPR